MLLPSALGFSPHPPVSVYGTGTYETIAAFLGTWLTRFATLISLHITSSDCYGGFANQTPPPLVPVFPFPARALHHASPQFCSYVVQESKPVVHRTTSFDLSLGPDLPRADQLYSGNLRYSAERILTFLSLLIPAFSLLIPPLLLPVQLRRS